MNNHIDPVDFIKFVEKVQDEMVHLKKLGLLAEDIKISDIFDKIRNS